MENQETQATDTTSFNETPTSIENNANKQNQSYIQATILIIKTKLQKLTSRKLQDSTTENSEVTWDKGIENVMYPDSIYSFEPLPARF